MSHSITQLTEPLHKNEYFILTIQKIEAFLRIFSAPPNENVIIPDATVWFFQFLSLRQIYKKALSSSISFLKKA